MVLQNHRIGEYKLADSNAVALRDSSATLVIREEWSVQEKRDPNKKTLPKKSHFNNTKDRQQTNVTSHKIVLVIRHD